MVYYYRLKPSKTTYDKDIKRKLYSYMIDIDGDRKIEVYVGESVTKRTDPVQSRLDRIIRNNHNESLRQHHESGQDLLSTTPNSQHHNSN